MKTERDFNIILPVAEQGVIDGAAVRMARHFGGVTEHPLIRGIWEDSKGSLVKDDNILLSSSRDLMGVKNPEQQLQKDRKFMKHLAEEYRQKLKQDAIWIEEDIVRDVQFITAPKKLKKVV